MIKYKNVEIYQTPEEVENLRKLVQETEDVPGVIAEIGTYQGATASIMREETLKPIYTFDTFEGFPDVLHETDAKSYFVGDCKAPIEIAKELLKDKDIEIIRGEFPNTSEILKGKKFSFVHIDVDIYVSTKNAINFFKDKMNKGGIILIHDYPAHRGVKKAVDEELGEVEVLGGRQAIWRT